MKLSELVSTGVGHREVRSTYSKMSHNEVNAVTQIVLIALMSQLVTYVNELPMPATAKEAYIPMQYECLPLFVRKTIVDRLDELYPEDELLQKFHSYIELCNIIGDTVTECYRARYHEAIKSLGITEFDIEQKFRKQN
jgi:hypothetical protein